MSRGRTKEGLRVEAVGGGAMDATASALAQEKKNLGSALEKGKGVERGRAHLLHGPKGRKRARKEARSGRSGCHGFVVAARRRTSACAQMDGDAWRFEKLQEGTRGVESAGARRVASGAGKRRRHGENREGGVRGWR